MGFLDGLRVLEFADEIGEYCGKILAGLGADVIKVEPPEGEPTRRYGPFFREHRNVDSSLHFWHYNFGKRGVVLDLDQPRDQDRLRALAATAYVVLESRPAQYFEARGIDFEALRTANPGLIWSRISPFGDDGPWAQYKGSDLVHLALGGVAMNCGYDPDPSGRYDTPPIAPQPWQAYQIAGEMAAIGTLGAILHRQESGVGQRVSTSVHQAVSQNTELDVPNWIFQRLVHHRLTARHSRPAADAMTIALSKDGRWLLPYRTYLDTNLIDGGFQKTVELLDKFGMAMDLHDEKYQDGAYRSRPEVALHIGAVLDKLVSRLLFERDLWRDAQELGLTWAPIRKPEENVSDPHWRSRETFIELAEPELGASFTHIGAKWYCEEVPWRSGPRAPHLGEHNDEILNGSGNPSGHGPPGAAKKRSSRFAVNGARVLDLGWILASAGGGRFLAALGVEVIKIEHSTRYDPARFMNGYIPPGGRAQRDAATEPIRLPRPKSPNQGGMYFDINAGKRSIGLNLKHPRGRELLARLIPTADAIVEGFSPGTMTRMGFGYPRLCELNPRIIYAQQSGMGEKGTYGQMRSYGPVAQAFSGLTEESGLPEPFPPAGIGYSYLDWFGAYNLATAILAALYRQRETGRGCWIDSSQVEPGIYLTGPAVLDHSVNGAIFHRSGNRSPFKSAAPHGIYRAAGDDRWIAISCFSGDDWHALIEALGAPAWGNDPEFATLEGRVANQDRLDAAVASATAEHDPFALMHLLQKAGVAAGVCQTAEDRCENDPQLSYLGWLKELPQTDVGTWPARQVPTTLSETPAEIGGPLGRHGASYAEDNEYVFGEILGLSGQEISELRAENVI